MDRIDAGTVLGDDPMREVKCPRCQEAVLKLQDVRVGTMLKRICLAHGAARGTACSSDWRMDLDTIEHMGDADRDAG